MKMPISTMRYIGDRDGMSLTHFVFFSVFVIAFVFVIVITGASVDSTCHELSEYVWLYGSVKHT